MNDEKKKNKLIAIGVGICAAIILIATSTYAYWTITKSQKDPNQIVAACLDIDMQSVDGTFAIDPAWPISDEEGLKLEGYTFKVENNCPEAVNYIIGMDSLEVSGDIKYLNYDNIKISVDSNEPIIFGGQDDIEHVEANDTRTIKDSKKLYTATVDGKVGTEPGKNEHNVKVWISSESSVEEQSRVFSGRMFITGGQKIENDSPLLSVTPETCFEMDTETGTEIIGYDESCGDSVVVPATVKENPVKTIDSNAFKGEVLSEVYYGDDIDNSGDTISPVDSVDVSSANVMFIFDNYNENTGIDLSVENVIGNATYIVKLTSDAPVNATVDAAGQQYGVANKIKDSNNIPELTKNKIAVYANLDATFSGPILGAKYLKANYKLAITGLDLSRASNLELIEEIAFTNVNLLPNMDRDFLIEASNFPTGLTSLTFGDNINSIKIGSLAFAKMDLDNLTVYSTLQAVITQKEITYAGAFTASNIDNLTIKATNDDTKIEIDKVNVLVDGTSAETDSQLYFGVYYKNLIIEEGIVEIGPYVFSGIFAGESTHVGETLILPNSLKVIGDYAFHNVPFNTVNLGSNLEFVGKSAFGHMTAQQVINVPMTQAAFEAQVNRSDSWSDEATIIYQ